MKYYCTAWPSKSLNNCCKQHDEDYTEGSGFTRKEADQRLKKCIHDQGHPVKAVIFYLGVRTFGWIFWQDRWRKVLNKILNRS